MDNRYYIVRGEASGLFAGRIAARSGREVTMRNVRQLWYWDGAKNAMQIAAEGVKRPENCKFTQEVAELVLLDASEVLPCTPEAEKCIREVAAWKVK